LANYPGLVRRSNTWYARKRVPVDITDMYKSDSVKRSLKTDSLDEAKQLYHIKMLEIQSDFDQKRKERDHKGEADQLSKFNEASLLGLALEWYRETQGKVEAVKKKNIGTQYSPQETEEAIASTRLEKQNYHEALQSNDFEVIYPTAQKWLKRKAVTYDVNSKAYDLFCHYLLTSLVFMRNNDLKEYTGKTVSKTVPSIFDPVAAGYQPHLMGQPEPMLLTDLLTRFLKQSERDKFDTKTNQQYKTVVRLFHSYAGKELFIHDVTRMYIEDYRDTLMRYPSRAHTMKIFRGKPFHEIIKMAEGMDVQRMNISTINTHISNLHSLFDYAELNELIVKNPARKLMLADLVDAKEKRHPWPLNKLSEIFQMPLFQSGNPKQFTSSINDESLYWCCLISLWAGMNLKEIVHLHVADLKNEDGVLYLDVVSRPEQGSKLKSVYRVRRVPLHHELIRLGLPDFFKARGNHERLFYELTNKGKNGIGDPVGKRFGTLIERHGIKKKGSEDTGKCGFHSFRHNYRDALRDTEMNKDIQHALGGWSTGEKKTVADGYGSGYTLEKLNVNLQKISYPKLDLTHLHKENAKDGSQNKAKIKKAG